MKKVKSGLCVKNIYEKETKNFFLDGMRKFILEESLDEKGVFRSYLAGSYYNKNFRNGELV